MQQCAFDSMPRKKNTDDCTRKVKQLLDNGVCPNSRENNGGAPSLQCEWEKQPRNCLPLCAERCIDGSKQHQDQNCFCVGCGIWKDRHGQVFFKNSGLMSTRKINLADLHWFAQQCFANQRLSSFCWNMAPMSMNAAVTKR